MNFKTALMASALMAFAGLFATGCGDACSDAEDHAEECGFTAEGGEEGEDVDCSGTVECQAGCFNDAPCGAFDGSDADAAAAYLECAAGC